MWWLWLSNALAEPISDEDVAYEIVVQGQRVESAHEGVHQALRALGYRKVIGDHRAVYLTPSPWRPWVVLNDEGFVRVRSLRVLPLPGRKFPVEEFPGIQYSPSGDTLPPPMSISLAVQSRKVAVSQRGRVVTALEPHLAELREARWALAKSEGIAILRAELVGIWVDGVAPDGTPLPTYAERREALLARWRHTTEGKDGEWVRERVEAYVEQVVQVSDHPFREPVF